MRASKREADKDKKNENDWQELSEQILTDIQEWRRNHSKATFREIEDEVQKRMSRLEAQVLQDAAQTSESREWGGKEGQERPKCPACQTPRWLHGTCPSCGVGIFPPR